MELCARFANTLMLVDTDAWPKPSPKVLWWFDVTYGISLELGLFSVPCLIVGAMLLMHNLASP